MAQQSAAPTTGPASPAPTQARTSMPPPAPAQPYPAYAYQGYPPVAQERFIPFDKNWYLAKLVLTGLSVVWCIILFSLALAVTFSPYGSGYYYGSPITVYWCLPLVIPTVIWDIAELITICACGKRHGNKQGIHPGAHVGVDLIIWLACLLCVLVSTFEVLNASADRRYCSSRSAASDRYYGDYCADYSDYQKYLPQAQAILAFVCLLTITHFVVFVRACVETNQRNRTKPAVIMVPAGQMPLYYGAPDPRASMVPQQEKGGVAPAQAQGNHPDFTGFYAPQMPAQPAPARRAQGNSGEAVAV